MASLDLDERLAVLSADLIAIVFFTWCCLAAGCFVCALDKDHVTLAASLHTTQRQRT